MLPGIMIKEDTETLFYNRIPVVIRAQNRFLEIAAQV